MRQTSLSLEELCQELASPTLLLKRCLVINEVGVIYTTAADGDKDKAEAALVGLLKSESEEDQYIAYSFLLDRKPGAASQVAIDAFKTNPANAGVITMVAENRAG